MRTPKTISRFHVTFHITHRNLSGELLAENWSKCLHRKLNKTLKDGPTCPDRRPPLRFTSQSQSIKF